MSTAPRHTKHDPIDESTQPPPASTSHSEAHDLLLLQDYVRNVSQAQLMLEQTSASLQRTEVLTGIFSEHDLRTLRTACQCLNSLRIRVEARANTVERTMIEQQLQFMQSRVQPVSTEDLRTDDTSCPSRTYADHFMTQDHPHWPFRLWTLWWHSATTWWQPLRRTLWCHQDEDDWKSTTERILSVPWAPLYRLLVITYHPRSFSPPLSLVSHHFRCYTAWSLLASKCSFYFLWVVMPDGLPYVISGILAGGIPGFRIVLCCFTHSTVWQCDVCVCVLSFVLFPAIPIPELMQCYHLTLSLASGLDRRSLSILLVCFVWVVFLVFVCVLVLFLLFCAWLWFLLFFLMDCDGCWTMYRSFSSPLLWLPSLMAAPGMH